MIVVIYEHNRKFESQVICVFYQNLNNVHFILQLAWNAHYL